MKKLAIISLLLITSTLLRAQTYTVDSLNRQQAILIRNAVQSIGTDSLFYANDSLINIIKNINTQLKNKTSNNALFQVTLNVKALIRVFQSLGLYNDIDNIVREQNENQAKRRQINTAIKVILDVRTIEVSRGVSHVNSIFNKINSFNTTFDFSKLKIK